MSQIDPSKNVLLLNILKLCSDSNMMLEDEKNLLEKLLQ